jgi:HK97 gp10 family phage protein
MPGFDQMYEMADRLRDFPAEARPLLVGLLGDVSDDMERFAKGKVPVRTGFLRSTIKASPVIVRGQYGMIVHLQALAAYATFVEYGTSRMAPRPFLEPAAEFGAQEFEGVIDIVLEEL